jgi:hypothetical protein
LSNHDHENQTQPNRPCIYRNAAQQEDRIEQLRVRVGGAAPLLSADPQAESLSWLSRGLIDPQSVRRSLGLFVALLVECCAAFRLAITAHAVATPELMRPPHDRSGAGSWRPLEPF